MKYGIPILKEQFVIDSVNKGKLLDVSKYKLVETNEDDDDDDTGIEPIYILLL